MSMNVNLACIINPLLKQTAIFSITSSYPANGWLTLSFSSPNVFLNCKQEFRTAYDIYSFFCKTVYILNHLFFFFFFLNQQRTDYSNISVTVICSLGGILPLKPTYIFFNANSALI